MENRWRFPTCSSRASTVGRWMTSIRYFLNCRGWRGLLGVQLDDELLSHRHIDLGAERQVPNGDLEAALAGLEPSRGLAVERVEVVGPDDHRLRLVPEGHDVAAGSRVARDRDALAVHRDVAVAHELAGLGAGRAPPGAEHDVVEPQLEHLEQRLTGHALATVRLGVDPAELLLHEAVDAARLLLLAQLEQVLRALALPVSAGLTGRVRAALDRALHRVALGALEVELHALPAAEPADGTCVTSHLLAPQTRRRLGGRQPLWGTGVTSLMPVTSMPAVCSERIAVSRPAPGASP